MKKITILCILSLLVFIGNLYCGWLEKGSQYLKNMSNQKTTHPSKSQLSTTEIINGLKEALKVGTENVVNKLGKQDGFLKDKAIHIPLPEKLQKIKNTLKKIGLSNQLDNLEVKLNRAAELATPKAKKLFLDAISSMSIEDANKIYKGPDDAATQYFKSKMSEPLKQEMKPIVEETLNKVAAVQTYKNIISKYNSLPFVKPINEDLTSYTLDKSLDGIFYYLAKEELAIRKNPAKRTTELLKKVFGSLRK